MTVRVRSQEKMVKVARVSSIGRFRSTRGVISTPSPKASGYVTVKIEGKSYRLHRLIAVAFSLPHEAGQTTVDHIDNNPSNNFLSNLRWATPRQQTQHSYATNFHRKSNAGKCSKAVSGRSVGNTEWTDYSSMSEAARKLGLRNGHVSACCARKMTQTGGYEFKFATQAEPTLLVGEEWRDVVLGE